MSPAAALPGLHMDPAEFLRAHPPFDRLDSEALRRIEASLEVAYAAPGTRVLRRGGPRSESLYVVRKGALRLERDGQLLQVLEEGECCGFPSLIGRSSPHADVVSAEETLLYAIPAAEFERLMEVREFAEFFLADLSERLRRTAAVQPSALAGELGTPVGQLPLRAPLRLPPQTTVAEAARAMSAAGVSSLLVDGEPPGIVTDRDLRNRVLAEARPPDTAVAAIASRPLRSVPASATLFEALAFMLEHHVHHAPVEEGGRVRGIVTDTDLLRMQVRSPLYLLRSVERLERPEDLARYTVDLSAMVEALSWGGLQPAQIGPVVSRLNDALVQRLLRLAELELGPPPCRYAWLVFGSEGRMEQMLLTDQDNALVHESGRPGVASYFAALAERVVGGLVAAGFPPCRGGFMATSWRKSADEWLSLFRGWVETPEPRALVEVLNFFDFRVVHGTQDVEPLREEIRRAGREQVFLAHLARATLGLQPPLGAFRQIRKEEGGVDLKKGGIVPVVGLARLHALAAGSDARSTLERLEAAAMAGTLSREGATTAAEAFRFLVGLRLREQLKALRAGQAPGNHVRLENLSPLERQHLKHVFVAIRELQQATALRYALDRLA